MVRTSAFIPSEMGSARDVTGGVALAAALRRDSEGNGNSHMKKQPAWQPCGYQCIKGPEGGLEMKETVPARPSLRESAIHREENNPDIPWVSCRPFVLLSRN